MAGGHMIQCAKICLIDDDKIFGQVLIAVAEDLNITLEYFESLEDMGRVGRLGNYDLVLCDFFLEEFTGGEIADYIKAFFDTVPMIIVSADKNVSTIRDDWPPCVRGFLSKDLRPEDILRNAVRLASVKPVSEKTDNLEGNSSKSL